MCSYDSHYVEIPLQDDFSSNASVLYNTKSSPGQLCVYASFDKIPVFRFLPNLRQKVLQLRFCASAHIYTIKIYGTARKVSSSPNL